MASLQDRLRQQIKERKAKKVKSDLNNEVMKAEKQNKKNAGLRVYGKINKTLEKKLKKRGLSDAEIKRLKKQDVDNKGRFGANVKKLRTFFRDDKSAAPKPGKPTNTKIGPNMSKVNKPAPKPGKPTNTKIGPNMAKVNKPTPKPKANSTRRGPSGPMMTSMKAPSTGPKPRNKDKKVDLKKRGPSRPSMTGFKSGGKVRGDGICRKGKTKGRMV